MSGQLDYRASLLALPQCTGQTLAQNLASVPDLDFGAQSVMLPLEKPGSYKEKELAALR